MPRVACHPLVSSSADPKVHSPPKTHAEVGVTRVRQTQPCFGGFVVGNSVLMWAKVEQGSAAALLHWTLTRSSELQGGRTGSAMEVAAGLASKHSGQ